MNRKLSKVDDLIRPDHYYLTENDDCFFVGEYTARKGYKYSDTNQLIFNLKKSPKLKGTPQFKYKAKAIAEAATILKETLASGPNLQWLESSTLIPIPPSKTTKHELYDDRMTRILRTLAKGLAVDLDIRELIVQTNDMDAVHESEERPSPQTLAANYKIEEILAVPEPKRIGVFDDLLTAGCHFQAVKSVLSDRFPGTPIAGIFLARRVPTADDFGVFPEENE